MPLSKTMDELIEQGYTTPKYCFGCGRPLEPIWVKTSLFDEQSGKPTYRLYVACPTRTGGRWRALREFLVGRSHTWECPLPPRPRVSPNL